jgi:hypothetical protein
MLVIAWGIVFLLTILIGVIVQLLLFKSNGNTLIEALFSKPFLWFIYFFVAHFIGEKITSFFRNN